MGQFWIACLLLRHTANCVGYTTYNESGYKRLAEEDLETISYSLFLGTLRAYSYNY
jgi:hypothetical protein